MVKPNGAYNLSILKSLDGDPSCCCRYFFEYDAPIAGKGHFIHTYMGDGTPLPSFSGEPELVDISCGDAACFAEKLWNALNADNKVSLFVRTIDLQSRSVQDVIKNKNQGE